MVHNILNKKLLVVALAFDVAQTLCPVYHRRRSNESADRGTLRVCLELVTTTWGLGNCQAKVAIIVRADFNVLYGTRLLTTFHRP